jgi:4-hydroxy-3-polyprenylbenzoate decarboxylase/2,5-furandicarboxylate decarboxylase 1
VPKYSLDDGGPYITPGIVVSKDPETGVPDIGHYRFEIIDKQTMSFNALPNHRLGKNIAKARAMGHSKFHAAVVIGVDPLLAYTSPIQVPDDTNDWEVAAGLRGALVELVHAKTVDLDVAARAEVVIEFVADFSREVMEGPLGEYTGFYHRNGAIFQALLTGVPPTENHILKQLPFEASFFSLMRQQFPTLEKVAIPSSGGVSFRIVMAMKPRFAGEARSALLAAIGTNLRPKTVIVVDPDIDVHNSHRVEWATAFRMQPYRDVIVVDGLPGRWIRRSTIRSRSTSAPARRSASMPRSPSAR